MKKIRKIIPMLCKTPQHRILNKYIGQAENRGQYNGYLAIPIEVWNRIKLNSDEENPYETHYDLIPNLEIDIHGGWTYGEIFENFSTDSNFIPLLDIRKVDTTNYMVIGFDTCHINDNYQNWTAKEVREELFKLYDALINYVKFNS